ncbi:MAG: alpha/beta hydrolase [Devosia sp.]|uniref:alpha/beta fold hydrolase n=1 Tax=Devosia sp. TaxID=1871048 RepID=UPI002630437D|nr:alpha/beta hydrolase [Devosia sp.]MDB5540849.1 alpha/beta hydrolase [Devosia sp.]
MPQFQNGRASVHYEILGQGRPLLLIAGTASDGASWEPLLPLLPDRQLILIDNRASGQTRVDGPVELTEMISDCAALLDHLGLGPIDVVGHSLGGFLGLALAANHPEKVSRLVTMGAGTLSGKERVLLRDMSRLYFTVPPTDWFRLLFQWLFSTPFFADEANVAAAAAASTAYQFRQSPGDFARQVAAIDRAPAIDFSRVACEVLAISGDLDLLAPQSAVTELHRAVPGTQYVTIPNVAHSIHREAPRAAADAIDAFLREED